MTEQTAIESQNTRILRHLEAGNTLTPLQAFDLFGCFRLSARINDLKNRGHIIHREMVENGKKKYAEYSIKNPDTNAPGLKSKTIL